MTRSAAQSRWVRLALFTMFAVAGLFWTMAHYRGSAAALWAFPMQALGMMAAVVVALAGVFQRAPRRWPAAVVLICAAPTAQIVLSVDMLRAARHLHTPLLVLVIGSLGVVGMGLIILFTPTPAPHDPIARAVAQQRSSE